MPGSQAFDTDIKDNPVAPFSGATGLFVSYVSIELNHNPPQGEDRSYSARRALMALVCSSKPGFSRRANMFFLYASTPGWLNGFTPRV